MIVKCFTVNMKQENTYVVSDDSGECIIIDCGCKEHRELYRLAQYIETHSLCPVRLLCTHMHLDHTFGNSFVWYRYGLKAECHSADRILVEMAHYQAIAFGIDDGEAKIESPLYSLSDGQNICFGHSELTVIATPGHSPGGVSFYIPEEKILFSGDTLMRHDVGATNLPGARRAKLIRSIGTRLFTLPDDTRVFPGHGQPTTIGDEKQNNPIVDELKS